MTPRALRSLRPCTIGAIAAIAFAGVACSDHPANGLGLPSPAALAVAPGVTSVMGGPVFELAAVRVLLGDLPGSATVLDTVVSFAPGDSTLRLALTVQLMRPTQDFQLRVAAMDALGDTLFRSLDTVTLHRNESAPRPTSVVLQYSGPDTLVAAISLAPRDTSILVGMPLAMRPTAFAIDQTPLQSVRYGWRSSDPANVTVAPDGTVLALTSAKGVWIVATAANGRRDSTQISASPATAIASVSIDSVFVSLAPGDSLLLRATPRDQQGMTVNHPVTWSSLDSNLGVDTRGMVTALAAGAGRITATAAQVSDTVTITVLNPQLRNVTAPSPTRENHGIE